MCAASTVCAHRAYRPGTSGSGTSSSARPCARSSPSRSSCGGAGVKRTLRERLAYDALPPVGSALRGALVRTWHPRATLRFDRTVRFDPGFHVWMPSGRATLDIGPYVHFRRGCVIELEHDSLVRIGAGTVFTYNVVIQATVEVTIGERSLFANGASVVDSKHAFRDTDLAKLDFAP